MYRNPFVYQSAASRVGLKQRGYSWTMAILLPSILFSLDWRHRAKGREGPCFVGGYGGCEDANVRRPNPCESLCALWTM